ncbi:MAG TPA: NAD-dependent epimerase/dehydratase family protein [Candidatus Moranbacteria bacterium]|nr:NAD-dependent epimerase/dehydratase family protein [Candidatus Moranbacteria bacterium]
MKIIVTGGAGFIGSAVAKALMDRGEKVVLIDNFSEYYDPSLKEARVRKFLRGYRNKPGEDKKGKFTLYRADIRDRRKMERIFAKEKPKKIIHLAAMAGVRASLENPCLYADVNVLGTTLLLELSVKHKIKNFVYASTSSVYGANTKMPFSESDPVDRPISPYAASKRADELMAHVFSHIYKLPTTGLRFFTVYGPWGRPDMALFLFTEAIFRGRPINVFGHGRMTRNFTYVDDIVSGVLTALDADLPCEILNIGGDKEETLANYIRATERAVGKKAKKKLLPMQPGDVRSTVADISKLRKLGWEPKTDLERGVRAFVDWYRDYYRL